MIDIPYDLGDGILRRDTVDQRDLSQAQDRVTSSTLGRGGCPGEDDVRIQIADRLIPFGWVSYF